MSAITSRTGPSACLTIYFCVSFYLLCNINACFYLHGPLCSQILKQFAFSNLDLSHYIIKLECADLTCYDFTPGDACVIPNIANSSWWVFLTLKLWCLFQTVAGQQNLQRTRLLDHLKTTISNSLDMRTSWQDLIQNLTHERYACICYQIL